MICEYMHTSAGCLHMVDTAYLGSLRFITHGEALTHHCECPCPYHTEKCQIIVIFMTFLCSMFQISIQKSERMRVLYMF